MFRAVFGLVGVSIGFEVVGVSIGLEGVGVSVGVWFRWCFDWCFGVGFVGASKPAELVGVSIQVDHVLSVRLQPNPVIPRRARD